MVPSKIEAVNAFIFRELDATKNAISMAAQSMFSHKELQHKNGKEMQEMMWQQRGVNFNDYPLDSNVELILDVSLCQENLRSRNYQIFQKT